VGETIEALVAGELDALGFDLVELRRGGSRARPLLEVRMDRRDGAKVTLEDCTRASRALEARVEQAAMMGERYVLEVSSPGADRPLRTPAEWRRFVGRHAVVTSPLVTGGKQEVEILAVDGEDGAEVALNLVQAGGPVAVHGPPRSGIREMVLAASWVARATEDTRDVFKKARKQMQAERRFIALSFNVDPPVQK
jgi:ribosome maturation factor RimP